jgi:hypothetical protein
MERDSHWRSEGENGTRVEKEERNVPEGETKKIRKNKLSERRTERRKKKKEAG